MVETNNNETIKNTEKCYCQKKIVALAKEIKSLQEQLDKQGKQIETLKKVLTRK